jgi:hypothetical protein
MSSQVSPSGGQRTLIYVHSRHCKPAAQSLLDSTLGALVAGLERDHPAHLGGFRALNTYLAYYGDISNALLMDAGEFYDEQLDIGDRQNALLQLRAINRRKKFCLSAYDKLPGKSAMPELAADVAAPILGSIGLSKTLISKVAPDLHAYWHQDGEYAASVRAAVRSIICGALERNEQVLLISHGTGGIVTWDVLWQLSRDPRFAAFADQKIDTWITLGSPLGDSMVRRRLLGADKKGRDRFPGNIVSWHNVSAEDDWLCHDNTVADDFRPMLQQKQVSAIRDYRIYNLAVRYGKSDPHCSLGYLIHPRVTQILADWLGRPASIADPIHIF